MFKTKGGKTLAKMMMDNDAQLGTKVNRWGLKSLDINYEFLIKITKCTFQSSGKTWDRRSHYRTKKDASVMCESMRLKIYIDDHLVSTFVCVCIWRFICVSRTNEWRYEVKRLSDGYTKRHGPSSLLVMHKKIQADTCVSFLTPGHVTTPFYPRGITDPLGGMFHTHPTFSYSNSVRSIFSMFFFSFSYWYPPTRITFG